MRENIRLQSIVVRIRLWNVKGIEGSRDRKTANSSLRSFIAGRDMKKLLFQSRGVLKVPR